MVLRTNFKAFKVVSSEKNFFSKIGNFLTFFAYPGSQIFWRIANYFFEKYWPEICPGLHKWCCEQILRHLRLLRAKKIFSKIGNFLTFFAYQGSQVSWKMTNYFFERYWPEIYRGLHKWCCERILRHFRLFRAKKNCLRIGNFFTFFAYPGSQIFWKMANYFFEKYWPEICRGLHKWCCEQILRHLRLLRAKKIFSKIGNFLTFFAYQGSQISWKMTNYFFERYRPEIYRGLHKWCCERILRHFRLFRAKKNCLRIGNFFTFLHIRGHRFFEKWLTTFLRNTGLKFVVDCTNGVANEF